MGASCALVCSCGEVRERPPEEAAVPARAQDQPALLVPGWCDAWSAFVLPPVAIIRPWRASQRASTLAGTLPAIEAIICSCMAAMSMLPLMPDVLSITPDAVELPVQASPAVEVSPIMPPEAGMVPRLPAAAIPIPTTNIATKARNPIPHRLFVISISSFVSLDLRSRV